MKKRTKVLAWLLAVCMLVSMLPASVFAAGGDVALDSAWEVENQNNKLKINDDGSITITTEKGNINDEAMSNILYYKIPNQNDYEFTVKVQGNFSANYQGAFLMIASGKGLQDVVGVCRRYHGYLGGNYGTNMLMGVMQAGNPSEYYEAAGDIGNEFYLKLQKQNGRITGFYAKEYSENDADWNQIIDGSHQYVDKGSALINPEEIYLALGANAGGTNNPTDVTFSDLRIGGEPVAFVSNTDALAKVEIQAEPQVDVGKTMALEVACFDYEGNPYEDIDSVSFTSSDETIATVDDKGVVTGLGNGKVVITAEVTSGDAVRTASVELMIGQIVAEGTWTVTSPDGNTSITMELLTGGTLQYRAQQDGVENIKTSPLGLVTNVGDFTEKLVLKEASEVTEINETYEMYSGKADEYTNHCFEQAVTFVRKDGGDAEFTVVLRAYDDGTALRYLVNGEEGAALSITDETTGVVLPEEAVIHWMNYTGATFAYESQYQTNTTESLGVGATPSIPMIYGKDDVWTVYTEADLNGSYTGSMFRVLETGVLDVAFAKAQGTRPVQTTMPFASPWRVAITGTPEDIVENTLVENLATPADEETYKFSEWVEPGLSSWSWVASWGSGISDQSKAETHLNWIKFGAEIGWDYYILDEGWAAQGRGNVQPNENGMREWWPEVKAAAEEAGVKLWAWVHVSDIRDDAKREALFEYWASEGIVGLKPDFFDAEDQATMQLYDELYEDAAKYGLMLLVHGANKPTGEVRTWPNVYGREGIAGQEQGGITSQQYTLIPFIRAAVGPAEVTEELRSKDYNKTTMGFQVALTALIEDGIHSMGSAPDVYRSVPEAMAYYTNYPGGWEETQFAGGEIGQYLSIARRAGSEWYLSGITVEPRDLTVSLDFLDPEVKYTAMIIHENGRQDIDMTVLPEVTAESELEVSMLYGGGYAVKFMPLDESVEAVVIEAEHTLNVGETLELTAEVICGEDSDNTVTWTVEDASIATVNDGVLTAVAPGVTKITATANGNVSVSASAIVMVQGQRLDAAEGWEILNPSIKAENRSQMYADEPNKVTLTTLQGDVANPFDAQNVWIMDAPEGDFEVTMQVTGGMNSNWHKAGILVMHDQENTVSVVRRYHEGLNNGTASKNHFGMFYYKNGYNEPVVADTDPNAPAWLKMEKKGNAFNCYYSYDGESWNPCGNLNNEILGQSDQLKIGFYAVSGGNALDLKVDMENFTVNGEVVPLTALKTEGYVAMLAPIANITAQVGDSFESLNLPETVTAYFDNGTKADVKVIWNAEGFDSTEPGQAILTGELDLTGVENVANPDGVAAQITVNIEEKPFVNPFTDVKEGDWYYDSVMWAVKNQITSGATETTFNYDGLSERCQVVTFLWRAAGEPEPETTENPFTDVNEGHYFYKAVLWAYEKGITQGISDTEFGPFAKCTRGQVVTFLHRVEGTPESSFVNSFEDVNETHYFYDAVLWAAENGITVGRTDTTFDPEGQCKRSEIVTFLYRCMGK